MPWVVLLVAVAIVLAIIALVIHVLKWLVILTALVLVIGLLTGRLFNGDSSRR